MKKNKLFIGIMVIVSLVLVGCGRDVSTVESAIEGHWTMTDARLNDRPLVEVIEEYDEMLDIDSDAVTSSEEGQTELDVDFYYNEGILTIVNAEGEQTELPYKVISSDEENNKMTLEYVVEDEEVDLRLNEEITFSSEEREVIASNINIVDVELKNEPVAEEGASELERELNQIGRDLAMEFLRNMNFEFDLEYVDDAEAPTE